MSDWDSSTRSGRHFWSSPCRANIFLEPPCRSIRTSVNAKHCKRLAAVRCLSRFALRPQDVCRYLNGRRLFGRPLQVQLGPVPDWALHGPSRSGVPNAHTSCWCQWRSRPCGCWRGPMQLPQCWPASGINHPWGAAAAVVAAARQVHEDQVWGHDHARASHSGFGFQWQLTSA